MRSKQKRILILLLCVVTLNIVYAADDKTSLGDILFKDNMIKYSKPRENTTEQENSDIVDYLNKVKGLKRSGSWDLDNTEYYSEEDKWNNSSYNDPNRDKSKGSLDPGNRVSDDVYQIAKSMGPMLYPLPRMYNRVSSEFGERNLSYGSKYHKGIDLPCPQGTPVYAVYDGTVKTNKVLKYKGHAVELVHRNGVITGYYHMRENLQSLSVGQKVKQGDVIGYSSNTGGNYGYHLHLQINVNGLKNGTYNGAVNPLYGFIDPNKVKLQSKGGGYGGIDQEEPNRNFDYQMFFKD